MGEIAEMMLDGTLCEACGSYMGERGAPGFPQYCSRQCAEDRGAAEPRPRLEWLRVRKDSGLAQIVGWVRKREPKVNTYNGPKTDRRGDWIIVLGFDAKPDSDFGKFKGNSAAIWFGSEALARAGEAMVRKGLGWEDPQ